MALTKTLIEIACECYKKQIKNAPIFQSPQASSLLKQALMHHYSLPDNRLPQMQAKLLQEQMDQI